jgi:hypothetical protein
MTFAEMLRTPDSPGESSPMHDNSFAISVVAADGVLFATVQVPDGADREEIERETESLSITVFSSRSKKLPYLLPPADFQHFGY